MNAPHHDITLTRKGSQSYNAFMAAKSLDLHGVRADEVVDKVDHFIMQANQAGFDKVRIVTGKGTGTVKKIVIDYLKMAKYPWHYEKSPNGKDNEGVLLIIL